MAPWLADAVDTGIPPTAVLEPESVPIVDETANVSLGEDSAGDPSERALALQQFERTLRRLPGVADVNVTVGTLPIGGDSSASLTEAPIASATAVAIVDGKLGRWDGNTLQVFSSRGVLPEGAHSPAMNFGGSEAAFVTADGAIITVAITGNYTEVGGEGVEDSAAATTTVLTGRDLIQPSYDRFGWLWTAERANAGQLVAVGPGDQRVEVEAPWLAGREVLSVRLAADGARAAVLSREGGFWRVDVVGLVRSSEGEPIRFGGPESAGTSFAGVADMVWVDNYCVAVLGAADSGETPELTVVAIGGRSETLSAVAGAEQITARNGLGSMVVTTTDGQLYVRSSSGWVRIPATVDVDGVAFAG